MNADAMTLGFDHVGLTVADLESSRLFFVECLGWKVVGERPSYPAVYVSDGRSVLTLWRVENQADYVAFDRRKNVGLHHLALKVADRAALDAVYARVAQWKGVTVEFAPAFSGKGPKVHLMIREPGGHRIEFSWDPR